MWLVVGLGNPGTQYASNRHNVGFMAAAEIAAAFSFGSVQKKFHGRICAGEIEGTKALILLPDTYMNESGRAVQAACTFHKIPPENVLVLHDELDLLPGKIRVKQGGGNGGHNGLKSIDVAIGANYWRIRLGIGRPPVPQMDTADYVLANFSVDEKKWLQPMLKSIAAHLPVFINGGNYSELMNRVTRDMPSRD